MSKADKNTETASPGAPDDALIIKVSDVRGEMSRIISEIATQKPAWAEIVSDGPIPFGGKNKVRELLKEKGVLPANLIFRN